MFFGEERTGRSQPKTRTRIEQIERIYTEFLRKIRAIP